MKYPKPLKTGTYGSMEALTFSMDSPIVAVALDNGIALKCNRAEQCFEHLTLSQHYSQKVYPHKYIFAD